MEPASVAVTERNGGRLVRQEVCDGVPLRFFWIELQARTAPHS